MLIIFQMLFLLFALYAIIAVVKRRRDGLLSVTGVAFWILFWVAAAWVVISPNSTQVIATHLGIGRGTDLVVYASIALIFFVLFRLHVKVESVSRDITKAVREEALKEIIKK